ncbi:15-cis-phytoene synthase [Roseicitreum antarcticum]|uniref:Phytoene synthase n=1 Tax=Roseicitreum antarcticum TaxID=564137 RepID=A0A1H2QJ90_9RHOB|nr:phytoene/squalene synthase family protein [Roseicitreum antarcticum]SDW07221.1 phytoene synthase [Roseicitreum antarcticum]
MIDPADLTHCEEAIRTGSLSFHAASKLLPGNVRDPALALYAFCRLADDAVDLNTEKSAAVLSLRDRLDLAYAGRPRNAPADRAFAAIVEDFDMPRALPEALLEGLAWDAMERRYDSLSDLLDYAARVAATVGAMMCVLMRARDADTLARACDLGLAMQLTNIARDIGEDAQAGRIYLPLDWMDEFGVNPAAFLADPQPTPAVRRMTKRLLSHATRLYLRAGPGITALPLSCRPGIQSAQLIYAAIGQDIARAGYDSVTRRARTTGGTKLWAVAKALSLTGAGMVMPRSAVLFAPPSPEVRFLVDAAAKTAPVHQQRPAGLLATLRQLEAKDRSRRGLIVQSEPPIT